MPATAVYLFGPPRLVYQEKPLEVGTAKATALISYLAVTQQKQRRETLAALLWSQLDQKHAFSALRTTLWKIGKTGNGRILSVQRDLIGLTDDPLLWVDTRVFLELLHSAEVPGEQGCPHRPEAACEQCLNRLSEAVSLYCSGFMTGFSLRDSPPFDEWQVYQAEEFRLKLESIFPRLVGGLEHQEQYGKAVQYLRQWIKVNPYHEEAQRRLINLYKRTGQHAAAVRQYREYSRFIENSEKGLEGEPHENSILIQSKVEERAGSDPLGRFLLFLSTTTQPSTSTSSRISSKTIREQADPAQNRIIQQNGGKVVEAEGSSILAVFPKNSPVSTVFTLRAHDQLEKKLFSTPKGRRMFIHFSLADTGEAICADEKELGNSILEAEDEEQILISEEAIPFAEIPSGTLLKNLGQHTLSSGLKSTQVYCLVEDTLKSEPIQPLGRERLYKNLPIQMTPFVGRTGEVFELTQLLVDPACRHLTIVGPGGMGKTRLAVEVARQTAHHFLQGVFFVSLATVTNVENLIPTIAAALNFYFFQSKGCLQEDKELLFGYLQDKQVLLVVDNFEHLLNEAALLSELLEASSKVKILVTSREPLLLRGEWVFPLAGLDFPEQADAAVENFGAVKLFLWGARRVKSGFQLKTSDIPHLIKICRMVQGLPLGIELASTWIQSLELEYIAEEIQENLDFLTSPYVDVPPRQRSLRAVFDYTWRQLGQNDQRILKQLSVFRGNFSSKAAEMSLSASKSTLLKYCDRSLLRQRNGDYFEFLEVLRLYVSEKLSACPEEETEAQQRHCHGYAAWMEKKGIALNGPHMKQALVDIDAEYQNVIKAWDWAVELRCLEEIDQISASLSKYYEVRGRFREAEKSFGKAILQLGGTDQEVDALSEQAGRLLSKLLLIQVWFCRRLGKLEEGSRLLWYACRLTAYHKDPFAIARCRYAAGSLAIHYGSLDQAAHLLKVSAEDFRLLKKPRDQAISFLNLATISPSAEQARSYFQQSMVIFQELGDSRSINVCLNNLAHLALEEDNAFEAKQLTLESVRLADELGDPMSMHVGLANLGLAHERLGEYEEAIRCHQKTLELSTEMSSHSEIISSLGILGRVYLRIGDLASSREYLYLAINRIASQPFVFSGEAAEALIGLASLYYEENRLMEAARLVSFVLKKNPNWRQIRSDAEELSKRLQLSLAHGDYLAAAALGEKSSWEELIHEIERDLGQTKINNRHPRANAS